MNVTLSADDQLVEKARQFAAQQGTTLNQLFRDYLEGLVGAMTAEKAAEEFEAIATSQPGRSPDGWKFDRQSIQRYAG